MPPLLAARLSQIDARFSAQRRCRSAGRPRRSFDGSGAIFPMPLFRRYCPRCRCCRR